MEQLLQWCRRQSLPQLIVILIIGGLCGIEALWLVHDIRATVHDGRLHVYQRSRGARYRAISPEAIEPWMTFDYINVIFHLPHSYLKTSLDLRDPYLNLSIKRYAVRNHESPNELLIQVKEAVRHSRPIPPPVR